MEAGENRFANLQKLGVDEKKAWIWANTRKSYWRIAHSPILTVTLSPDRFKRSGYLSFNGMLSVS